MTKHAASMHSPSATFNVGTGYELDKTLIVGAPTYIGADSSGASSGSGSIAYSYNSSTGILSITATSSTGGWNSFSMTFSYYTAD